MQLHSTLQQQLRRAGHLNPHRPPGYESWRKFLEKINRTYTAVEHDGTLQSSNVAVKRNTRVLQSHLVPHQQIFFSILSALSDALVYVDGQWMVAYLNPSARKLLGPNAAVGFSLASLLKINSETTNFKELESYRLLINLGKPLQLSGLLLISEQESREIRLQLFPMLRQRKLLGMFVKLEPEIPHSVSDANDATDQEDHLAQLQQQLMEASRQAGMAEVASGILHNVGNVLNSVNVSIDAVYEKIKNSVLTRFDKVSAVFQNESDLVRYFQEDPRSGQITHYIAELCKEGHRERNFVLQEVSELAKHVDHIKAIIAMQQSYARLGQRHVTSTVSELLDDALRVSHGSFRDLNIQLEITNDTDKHARVDRHRCLLILVNLLKNAGQAVRAIEPSKRRVTVQCRTHEDRVLLTVADNGAGIASEHLSKIFAAGFTTKPDGHGLGLHSSALAAEEMGGSLQCKSDGPAQGAQFILDLPIQTEVSHERVLDA